MLSQSSQSISLSPPISNTLIDISLPLTAEATFTYISYCSASVGMCPQPINKHSVLQIPTPLIFNNPAFFISISEETFAIKRIFFPSYVAFLSTYSFNLEFSMYICFFIFQYSFICSSVGFCIILPLPPSIIKGCPSTISSNPLTFITIGISNAFAIITE